MANREQPSDPVNVWAPPPQAGRRTRHGAKSKDELATALGGLVGVLFGLMVFRPLADSLSSQWINTLTALMATALGLASALLTRYWVRRLPQ
jgi:VIT1/CCC1 family predicted Fe2+/Mn2+ transporter